MKGTALLHPACHPKDASRKRSQMMFDEKCKEKFKNTLNTDKCMIACHNPDDVRRLTMPRSLKKCGAWRIAKKCHADEAGISAMDNGIDISRRTKEILDKKNNTKDDCNN